MTIDQQKTQVLEFIKMQKLGVLATIDVSGQKPESAVAAFSETENLELIFGTFYNTRKFPNLLKNPQISFVIGWDDFTVQYEGVAKLTEGEEMEMCRKIHLTKNPSSKKYAFEVEQRFFKVTPQWLRFSDFSVTPEQVFEIEF